MQEYKNLEEMIRVEKRENGLYEWTLKKLIEKIESGKDITKNDINILTELCTKQSRRATLFSHNISKFEGYFYQGDDFDMRIIFWKWILSIKKKDGFVNKSAEKAGSWTLGGKEKINNKKGLGARALGKKGLKKQDAKTAPTLW